MLEPQVIVVMWWIWPIVKPLCRHQRSCSRSEKLRRLSEPAALETLLRYFDATCDSDVASAPVQVGQIF